MSIYKYICIHIYIFNIKHKYFAIIFHIIAILYSMWRFASSPSFCGVFFSGFLPQSWDMHITRLTGNSALFVRVIVSCHRLFVSLRTCASHFHHPKGSWHRIRRRVPHCPPVPTSPSPPRPMSAGWVVIENGWMGELSEGCQNECRWTLMRHTGLLRNE